MVWEECTHSARPLPGGNPMAVSPCSLFFSIPLGKVALPSRRCGISKGCGWYRLCPPRLQYDRFELEVHTYYWYAPFLADTKRLMQAVTLDVTGGDNQLRGRPRFDDGTQVSHSAANGHTIDSAALQPWIIVKKANGTEPKARILQQFA